jgi:prepilin-type N-terminal cleavage/methylation domain-containing protein/prepilin-type processing-associated H-X9-DG protein
MAPLALNASERGFCPGHPTRRRGFTLIELFVVLTIIMILVSLLLPAVQQAREAARRTGCRNNLMQIGLALRNYESAHECLPPGTVDVNRPVRNDGKGYQFGWAVQILPQLDLPNVHAAFDFRVGVYDKANHSAALQSIPVFTCPAGRVSGSYAACHHDVEAPIDVDNSGVMFLNSSIRRDDVRDGASNTIYVGEAGGAGLSGWVSGTRDTLRNTGSPINSAVPAGAVVAGIPAPRNANVLTVGGFGSAHAGGANFVFGDGTVRYLSDSISLQVLRQLGHRADGELPAGAF